MNKTCTIQEHEKFKEEFTKKEIDIWLKLNKLYLDSETGERGIVDIEGNSVRTKQYVGVIKIGQKTIQILPKIVSYNTEQDPNANIVKNLLYMLKYTKKLDIKETEISSLKSTNSIFEIIIYLFTRNLLDLLKKDLYKKYNVTEENNSYLKGKLLVKENITYNHTYKSRFYCEYDEFSENNLLNQIFKKTISKLINITESDSNFKLLDECNLILKNVALKDITIQDFKNIKFHRLNQNYECSYNMAKLLLFGNSYELNAGDVNAYSMLFDMNKLFEEFIGEFMKKNLPEFNISLQKRSEHVFSQVADKFTHYELKPDIYIQKSNEVIIIDTKYKKLNFDKTNYNVSQSDIYQMMMYGLRYFNYQENKKIILLYPEYDEKSIDKEIKLVTPENIHIFVKTINLHRNLVNNEEKIKLIREIREIISI